MNARVRVRERLRAALPILLLAPAVVWSADEQAVSRGSTIVGDQDSSLGLYVAPWQDEAPLDLDRPPRLRAPASEPVQDMARFREQVEYEESRKAYRRARVERTR